MADKPDRDPPAAALDDLHEPQNRWHRFYRLVSWSLGTPCSLEGVRQSVVDAEVT